MIGILGDLDTGFSTHRELQAEVARIVDTAAVEWIPTDSHDALQKASACDALWLIPGTPYKNDDVVYQAVRNAREHDQAFLGSCGGFQYAALEYARNVAGLVQAAHAEIDPHAEQQVIHGLSCSLIGQEREVTAVAGTRLAEICGQAPFTGYHYCNYGLSAEFIERLTHSGMVINSHATDAGVEGFELPDKRFFVATLFQPQVGALAARPQHPLIQAFVSAAAK